MFEFVARVGKECFCRSRGLSYDEHSLLEHAIGSILFLGWVALRCVVPLLMESRIDDVWGSRRLYEVTLCIGLVNFWNSMLKASSLL